MKTKVASIIGFAMFVGLSFFTHSDANGMDKRKEFDVDISIGWQFDRFTASELDNALNPEDSGDNEQSGLLDIRVKYKLNFNFLPNDHGLWLYGNTARTIRGTTVICEDNPKFAGCAEFDGTFGTDTIPDADVAFSILRDAESLEAHAGLRYEFSPLENSESASRPYISLQYGFASVEDTDDLADIHQLAFGLVAVEGSLKNSFVEIGKGSNDLFVEKPDERKIFKIHLEYEFKKFLIGFLETEVDFDSSTGSDSVRTKFGIEIPLDATNDGEEDG